MSTRVKIEVNNNNDYSLTLFKAWGTWATSPPKNIAAHSTVHFKLEDNDRAGTVYKAVDTHGREIGFVSMSFTCPKSSTNSAEGSPDVTGRFIPAGLQAYKKHGTPVDLTYHVGHPNMACWTDGSSDNHSIECDQTKLETWARAIVVVNNPLANTLKFEGLWGSNWTESPKNINLAAGGRKIFLLNDNDRAGIHYSFNDVKFNLSFTCPKSSTNSAEGSAFAGLQPYEKHDTPVWFEYRIGESNQASWDAGNVFSGNFACKETSVTGVQKNWMSLLDQHFPAFKNKKLNQIFWPGTHDSACWDMVSPFARGYTKTQEGSFLDQLQGGIRYFDLRIKYVSDTSFRFVHSTWNTEAYLKDLITALDAFYSDPATAKEVVILDFNHFHDFDTTSKKQVFLNTVVNSVIKNRLAPKGSANDTLDSLWKTKHNIIFSCGSSFASLTSSRLVWSGSALFASGWAGTKFWPNTDSISAMVVFLNNIVAGSYSGKLWVLQNILTPGITNTIQTLSFGANSALYQNLERNSDWESKTNIAIINYNSLPAGGRSTDLLLNHQLAAYALTINLKRLL